MASTLTNDWRFFSDREAWTIFRIAAFGEAFGWTLLISGITYKHFGLPNNASVLTVLGQTHGTFFFAYFAGLLAVARSLRLSRWQFLAALAASIPPYGTLVFEKYLAYQRRRLAQKSHREIIVRAIIKQGSKLLVVQPKKGTFWCLPGGTVEANESSEQALKRLVTEQLGVEPLLGNLVQTHEYQHHGQARLELFYIITNTKPYRHINLKDTASGHRLYDELAYVIPAQTPDLLPHQLRLLN